MHHPGPPRFVATGEEIELAPRDPDPSASYAWRLVDAPDGSTASLGDDPVEHFVPDASGIYVARLTAPDGEHDLTIRAFPGRLASSPASGVSGASGGRSGPAAAKRATARRSGPGSSTSANADADEGTGDGDGGRPRVKLSASVEADDVVVRADPSPNPRSSESVADLDVEFLVDDRDDLDVADARVAGGELAVPVDRLPSRVRIYAVAVGHDGYSVPDAIEVTREDDAVATDGGAGIDTGPPRSEGGTAAGAGAPRNDGGTDAVVADGEAESLANDAVAAKPRIRITRPYDPPAWAEDAVIYEIYVRSFGEFDAESEATAGGESADRKPTSAFDAIADRLDYLEDLGVDVLWLTPVLQNDHAPHGYNVTDFFAVASDLGTRDDYVEFVEAARDRGLKVLFDLVCNHSARSHPYFQAAVADPDGEYRDWYEWRTETDPETYFDWEHIANFDFDSLAVRRHLLDAVETWAPLVDGFRCDMAWAVPDAFWREIHDAVKARDAGFLLLDETIPYIPDFQAGLFDVHFDSTTYFALRQVGRGDEPASALLDAIDERAAAGFPDYAGFMLYAENHDETRYLVECGRPAAEAALGAVFTLPGAPMVYAGQEFGQRGKRDDLAWEHADESLREHVERLATLRHGTPALQADAAIDRVDATVADGDPERVVAYRRGAGDDAVVVVLNFGATPARVTVGGIAGPEAVRPDRGAVGPGASVGGDGALRVDSVAVAPVDGATGDGRGSDG